MSRWIPVVLAFSVGPGVAAAQQGPFELGGLVVTASPTPRSAAAVARWVTVLDADSLRARGIVRVADALREVPGLSVVQGGSFGATTSVFMRGGESDYVQVLVDGVHLNQPGGAFDFAGLMLDNIQRIEVLSGPASSLYGSDAVAGVINILTRTGRGPASLSLSFQGGSYGRREASVVASGGAGTVGWSFSLARLRTEGVLPFNNAHDNTVLSGTVRVAPDARTRARASVRLGDRTYRFPTDGAGAVVDRNQLTFGDESSVALEGTRWVGERVEVRGRVTLARASGGTDDPADDGADTLGFYAFNSLDHVQRAATDVRASAHLTGSVATVGVELADEKQRSFSESSSQWGVTSGRSGYARWNRAAYVHLTGDAGTLSYAVGGRAEDNQQFGRFPTWNLGLTWRAAPGVRVRASAGTAVKEPTFYENFAEGYARGNPDLAPERARSWEVGVEREARGGRVKLRASFFQQRFRDLIEYTPTPTAPGAPNYFNVAAADARGVEAGVEVRSGSVGVGASWCWLDEAVVAASQEDGPGAEFARGDALLRRPPHTLRLHAELAVRRGALSLAYRGVGARADRDFSTTPATRITLPSYAVVDAALELPLLDRGVGGPRLTLLLRGENLLDERYQEVAGFPAPGRAVYLGGRLAVGGR